MRKTRLVILPTKCLHQMGFLLLFLSCPVIGDWGRIRPDSENSHKAIQIDREGTCGLQRDPPGKLLNFLYKDGSGQCRPGEEFDSDGITKRPIFGEVRKFDERRVDSRRVTREGKIRETERREVNDERIDFRKAMQRVADERRNIRKEIQKGIRRDVREISQARSRSPALQQPSKDRQQENSRTTRRQTMVSARRFSRSNEIKSRNDRERLLQNRRMTEKQSERRTEQQRRSIRGITNERRENERTVRTAQEMREQTRRLVRSAERENQRIRRETNERSVRERSLQARDGDIRGRLFREKNQDRQNERLSLARKDQKTSRRSESGRNVENSERRFSQMRKARTAEIEGEVIEQRLIRNIDNRRDTDRRKLSGGDVRERRVAPLNARLDRALELKSMRISGVTKQEHLIHDVWLEDKNTDEKLSGGITKWMDLKRYESVKIGDWPLNFVIGGIVYFFSTRQIKAA